MKRDYKFVIERVRVDTITVEIESSLPKEEDTVNCVLTEVNKLKEQIVGGAPSSCHIFIRSYTSKPV